MSASGISPRPRRRLAAVLICAVTGLLGTACQGGASTAAGGSGGAGPAASTSAASASAAAARLTIAPANGSRNVRPEQGVTVTAASGKITSVTVATAGNPVSGALSPAGTSWHSTWALDVSQRYTVTARAVSASGQQVTQTSSFTTLTPASTFVTMIFEGLDQTYGVGMPIMLTFSQPITDRQAVERSLELRTSQPVVGAWHWDGSQTLDFRPRGYWPPHTRVSFIGHLNGVRAGPGLYGAHTLTQSFNIGASLIVVASTATHHMDVYRDGKLFSHWPISAGKPGDDTPNGTYLTIEKGNPVLMKGPGYALEVPFSVRITWSGDYLHAASWSVGQQGSSNVSHGCVNMRPPDAQIYYNMELPGDPVTVTGSPRAGVWDNGWTEWFLPWNTYLNGSALHEAVQAGPNGSSFVSPAALPLSTATAPLGAPKNDNWAAS